MPFPTARHHSAELFLALVSVARSQAEDSPCDERGADSAGEDDGYDEAGGAEFVLFRHAAVGAGGGGEA